jgi:opacity protein-like surface antigen
MKRIVCILFLILSQHSHAYSTFSGFYLKGGLGGTSGQFELSQELTLTDPQTPGINFTKTVNHDLIDTNVAGLVGIGYTHKMDQIWVLSGEFTAGFTSLNADIVNTLNATSIITDNGKIVASFTNDFSLLAKPGITIHRKTQFYVLIGPRWGNIETKLKENYAILGGTPGSFKLQNAQYMVGLTVGLGMERLLTEYFGIGLEYAYTAYGNLTALNAEAPYAAEELTGSVSTNNLLLYFSYRFY